MNLLKLLNPNHPEHDQPGTVEDTFKSAAEAAVTDPQKAAELITAYTQATTEYEADGFGIDLLDLLPSGFRRLF